MSTHMSGFKRMEGLIERHNDLFLSKKHAPWGALAVEAVGWLAEICQTLEEINNNIERLTNATGEVVTIGQEINAVGTDISRSIDQVRYTLQENA